MKSIARLGCIVSLGFVLAACASLGADIDDLGRDNVTGTIALATSAFARSAGLTYGGWASFDTEVSGRMASQSVLYVTVVCAQGGTVVYQASADPDATFHLSDLPGQGLEWDGGSAECSGTLVYKIQKGKGYDLYFLDETAFGVQGTAEVAGALR